MVAFLPPDRYWEISAQTARILRLVDGTRDVPTLAALASAELSLPIAPHEFEALLLQRLVPRGLVHYGDPPPVPPASPHRRGVVFLPGALVRAVARPLAFLFRPPVAALALPAALAAQAWCFLAGDQGGGGALSGWWVVALAYAVSMLAHELGHATALQSFGIAPGEIGIDASRGLPRWGSDVRGIWRLGRRQRIVVDLGGVYFQTLAAGSLILFHALVPGVVPWSTLAWAIGIIDGVVIACLLPWWRSDGYWLAADLAGRRHPRAEASPVAERTRREGLLPRALRSTWMDLQATVRLFMRARELEDAYGLLPVFIATSIGADTPPQRLRAHVRNFLREHAVMRLEHERLPGGARCHEIRNAQPLLDLARRGEGVLVCSLHYGPYFYVGSELLAMGLDVNLVSASAMIRRQDDMWRRVAEVHGSRLDLLRVENLSGTRSMLRVLQSGGLVLIYGDGQGGLEGSRSSKGHRTVGDFLSMPIRMWTGPAYLAQRAGAHVVCALMRRERWGRLVIEYSDPMRVPPGEDAPAAFTQGMFRWFDPRARAHPEQWAGWGLPHLFLGETGAAPRATVEALERERYRVAELMRAPAGRTRLRTERTRVAFTGEGDRYTLIDGPTRRVLEVDGLTAAVVGAAYGGVRLDRLPRDLRADVPRLSDIVAHLTLAGLARLEGPGAAKAAPRDGEAAGATLPVEVG